MNDSTTHAQHTHTQSQTHGTHRPREDASAQPGGGHRHVPATGLVHGDTHGRLSRSAAGIDALGDAPAADALSRAVQARALTTGPGDLRRTPATMPTSGATAGPALVIRRLTLAQRLTQAARATAQAAFRRGRTHGAAAALEARGQVFTDVSGGQRMLHRIVFRALRAVPLERRSPWHGRCAEIGCLNQAIRAHADPHGGAVVAVAIGTSAPGHLQRKRPCSSCSVVLGRLGVQY